MPSRSSRRIIRTASYILPLMAAAGVQAQIPDTAHSIAGIDATLLAAHAAIASEVWPDFDVRRVGLLYMLPNTGKVLARWPAAVDGAQPLSASLVWTTAPVGWLPTDPVQVVPVDGTSSRADVLGLALHEAFHVHQQHFAGSGSVSLVENSMLLPRYPVFDAENEARVAVESELLRAAVEAPSIAEARRLAAQFVALRRARHAELSAEIAEFERIGEAHEGIAQYVLLRGLDVLAQQDASLRPDIAAFHVAERAVLSRTLSETGRSVRRRVYATGSQMGYLLDRLTGDEWKGRVTTDRVWLQDLVAEAVGDAVADTGALAADVAARLPTASRSVARLASARVQRRRAILQSPGTLIVLSPSALPDGRFEWCGFDPQNLLPDGDSNLLHTRMLTVCSGGTRHGSFRQPVVENQLTGSLHARADAPALAANGRLVALPQRGRFVRLEDLELTTETITISVAEAVLIGTADGVVVIPLR